MPTLRVDIDESEIIDACADEPDMITEALGLLMRREKEGSPARLMYAEAARVLGGEGDDHPCPLMMAQQVAALDIIDRVSFVRELLRELRPGEFDAMLREVLS